MKRPFSLFLSIMIVFSMVSGTFAINASAEVSGGSFTTASGEVVKAFTEDFNSWRNEYWGALKSNQNAVVDSESNQVFKVTSRTSYIDDENNSTNSSKLLLTTVESKKDNPADKYVKFTDKADDNSYHGRFYFGTGAVAPAEGETLHLSLDLMTEDSNYRKFFGVSDHLNTDMLSDVKRIIEFSSDGNILLFDDDIEMKYEEDKWYHFDILWNGSDVDCYIDNVLKGEYTKDVSSYICPTYKFTGFWITHLKNNRQVLYTPDKADAVLCADNLSAVIFNDSMIADSITEITSIGTDGKLPYDATELSFTMNGVLPALKAEHLKFTPDNGAASIEVTSDGSGSCTVTAQFEESLIPWTTYTLEIDRACFDGKEYTVNSLGFPKAVDTITASFDVDPAPFSLKSPEFIVDGSELKVQTTFVNNTQDAKWPCFMLVTKDADGIVTGVEYVSEKDIITDAIGEAIEVSASNFTEGSAEFFVTDGYTNAPLFDVSYGYNYDESAYEEETPEVSTKAAMGELKIGSFIYGDKTMEVDLKAGSDAQNGLLYIHKRGASLKDSLIYADYVVTAEDGSLKKEIKFPEDIDDVTGEYTVAFCADGVNLTGDFVIYDSTAASGSKIAKAVFDSTGREYAEYNAELSDDIWSYSFISESGDTEDLEALSLKFTRTDKDSERIIITAPGGKQTEGVHTIGYKFYGDNDVNSDGYVDFSKAYFISNRVSSSSGNWDGTFALPELETKKWYDIRFVYDLESSPQLVTFTVTDVEENKVICNESLNVNSTNAGFSNIWAYVIYEDNSEGKYLVKDVQFIQDLGEEKPVIRYIGNNKNDIVEYGQNEITFKVSHDFGFDADDVYVLNAQGQLIEAESLSEPVIEMNEYIYTAVFDQNFSTWQDYTLCIDAVGYEDYRELKNGSYHEVSPVSRSFITPTAPFDISSPEFTVSASSVQAESKIKNDTSNNEDATLVMTVCTSDGVMKDVVAHSSTANKNNVTSYTVSADFEQGDVAKIFAVESLSSPKQLFDKYWAVKYDGTVPMADLPVASSKAGSKAIEFNKYNFNSSYSYDENKIVVNLNTGANTYVNGILCVYNTADGMSQTALPLYIDYVSTAADGTLEKEILFDSSFTNASAEYSVEFYSKDIENAISNKFSVYAGEDYEDYKRSQIFNDAKKSSTFSGLMQVITGTDSNGEVVTEAWDIFTQEADVTYYNMLHSKEDVYILMSTKLSSVNNFDELVTLFENLALQCYKKETTPSGGGGGGSSPSSSNKNYGSSSTVISESVSASDVVLPDSSENESGSVESSVFSDMNGHWASKHADSLFEKGIINGYEDGSFRGDNSITRAELTKIIVEALGVPSASGKSFADVSANSWYSSYIQSAAAAGVVNGFEDGSFGPDNSVTRQDAALMIYRAMNLTKTLPTGYKFFADEKDIADYASDAIRCLGDLGIITGVGKNTFQPLENITRGEMAALICRAIDYIESHLV